MLNGKLVTSGNDPVRIQINQGVVLRTDSMAVTHEEAETMIIQQLDFVSAVNIPVVADDTLLCTGMHMHLCSYMCPAVT